MHRTFRWPATFSFFVIIFVWMALPSERAWAGIDAWRVNEVFVSSGGDTTVRFVELYAPPSPQIDNCFFPTTSLEIVRRGGQSHRR